MKSTVALSLLAAATAQATNGYSNEVDVSGPAFLNSAYNAKAGEDFNVKFKGCSSGCTITVKEGQAGNLQNTPISFDVSGSESTIKIPADAPNGRVALEIKDKNGNINYSPQFEFNGGNSNSNTNNDNNKPVPVPAPAATESAARDSTVQPAREAPTESAARESTNESAVREATTTAATTTTANTGSNADSDTTTTTATSSEATRDVSSSTLSSGTRNASRTTSSSTSTRTSTSTSTRIPGDSGVGRNAVPWVMSGAMAALALFN
ncbi:hypothetical protein XA68_11363 [Ophiocordyceps unilateralis]|uniref:Uncharacterized protein n=1 Tax=Ophiocordyceps unilateralis TaxID=268505 RepID=A0A2A9P244_OPHUN|nr:hypothetical protein XA68_11363 [Ophiocordyceps unilateralis]